MMWLAAASSTGPAEGGGARVLLVYLAVGLALLLVIGPLAWLVGRDANRRGRNGWAWGLLFLWQPIIVGVAYLAARRRPRPPVTPSG